MERGKFRFKKRYILFILIGILFIAFLSLRHGAPRSLRSDIECKILLETKERPIRIAFDPLTRNLFYCNLHGNIFQIKNINEGEVTDTLIYTKKQHGISFLQGMIFVDSTLFLVGNIDLNGDDTKGLVKKGRMDSKGNRIWSTVAYTDKYPSSRTAYDHKFSGITVSPDRQFLFISSGSRTDHGEVQSNGGKYPNMREIPLTSAIFKLPINSENLKIPNDSAALAKEGLLFADGLRNTFDMAFTGNGHFFGVENSGDRDDPDELNWLKEGHHYGFPWNAGGNANPQISSNFDPEKDKLLDHHSHAYKQGYYHKDSLFPPLPLHLKLIPPILNEGPDADKYRDAQSGKIEDASEKNIRLGTFTSHRSPLGLVFDNDSVLVDEFKGDGFMLSWTTPIFFNPTVPLDDPGEDLVHLNLMFDKVKNVYTVKATRIVANFSRPIDAEIINNKIYVVEQGFRHGGIWVVTLPVDNTMLSSSIY